ncbi:hypothetical protein V5799_018543 [Amblyomma americanum]|uniref:Uncharacterized protein n=1 Tax=Amblyomma americanum TaxID=6943 RepID=A0AAQ4EZS5_AMBAM
MTAHQQLLDVHSNMGLELFKTMCTAFLPSAHIQPYTFPSPGPSWLCGVDSVEVAGCNGQSWGVRVGGVGLWRAHMATT